jgi:hypothetical protein
MVTTYTLPYVCQHEIQMTLDKSLSEHVSNSFQFQPCQRKYIPVQDTLCRHGTIGNETLNRKLVRLGPHWPDPTSARCQIFIPIIVQENAFVLILFSLSKNTIEMFHLNNAIGTQTQYYLWMTCKEWGFHLIKATSKHKAKKDEHCYKILEMSFTLRLWKISYK